MYDKSQGQVKVAVPESTVWFVVWSFSNNVSNCYCSQNFILYTQHVTAVDWCDEEHGLPCIRLSIIEAWTRLTKFLTVMQASHLSSINCCYLVVRSTKPGIRNNFINWRNLRLILKIIWRYQLETLSWVSCCLWSWIT